MFRSIAPKGLLMATILLSGWVLKAQNGMYSTQELKKLALEDFEKGDFENAFEKYNSLIERYPKDGVFNYYAGVSLYKLNRDIPKAIEFLDYSTAKPMVPIDAFYYLGKAYRKNYQFEESRKSFEKFAEWADRKEQKIMIPEREARMSLNAINMTTMYNPFEILATSLFSFEDPEFIKQVRGKGGSLQLKPDELISSNEDPAGLSRYMFLPKNQGKGEYLYYAAESRKSGTDIYRVKKINGNKFGKPQELSPINTEYDELFPYFDPVGQDLYFASMGHSSIGGFDIFKSRYDQDRNEWSEPVAISFPVNSPENEFLLMPGADLGTVFFITDRQGLDTMLTAYKLKLKEPRQNLSDSDPEEIRKIGQLGGIHAIPMIYDLRESKSTPLNAGNPETEPGVSGVEPKSSAVSLDDYQSNLNAALQLQKQADSLSALARNTRIEVRDMPDPNERWSRQREIIEWEKMATDLQQQADALFLIVQSMDQDQKDKKTYPETIKPAGKVGDITVYEYTDTSSGAATASMPQKSPPETVKLAQEVFGEPGIEKKVSHKTHQIYDFEILDRSPYHAGNRFGVNIELPGGTLYRIQLGAFSNLIEYDAFKGITPITAEIIEDKGFTRYYAGMFSRFRDAEEALERVRAQGFNDAIVVAWYDGERTPVSRVMQLEERDQVE